MLEKHGSRIDAVTVSTPDHHHAPAAMRAMELGINVYVQKPLSHTVWEARQMRLLAKEKGVCTQMGNQGTADNGLRAGAEFVQKGGLGKVKDVHVWTNRPVWPQAPGITERFKDKPPVPAHIDWDSFIGPAPMRPYHPNYTPFKWRGWWDYGTGALGGGLLVAAVAVGRRFTRRPRSPRGGGWRCSSRGGPSAPGPGRGRLERGHEPARAGPGHGHEHGLLLEGAHRHVLFFFLFFIPFLLVSWSGRILTTILILL